MAQTSHLYIDATRHGVRASRVSPRNRSTWRPSRRDWWEGSDGYLPDNKAKNGEPESEEKEGESGYGQEEGGPGGESEEDDSGAGSDESDEDLGNGAQEVHVAARNPLTGSWTRSSRTDDQVTSNTTLYAAGHRGKPP